MRLSFSLRTTVCTIFLLLTSSLPSHSQQSECITDPLASSDTLDDANVRARIFNNGALFWNGGQNLYEVPKDSRINSVFTASIWIAGFVESELRGAASTFGPYEYWPGPLDEHGLPPEDCTLYDRIWDVRQSDIEAFDMNRTVTDDLVEWPWQLGAPVLDGDGDPTNYDIYAGDRPDIIGTQALWWIMNDRGGPHLWTESEPIGLEIHASAIVFNSQHQFLSNATFYKFRIINKNDSPIEDARFGFYMDVDMGNASDDYVGSDSLLQLGYVYNGDPDDQWDTPPAVGVTLLTSPRAAVDQVDNDLDGLVDEYGEQVSAGYIMHNNKGGVQGDPSNLSELWSLLRGRWLDESPLTEGGEGYAPGGWPSGFPQKRTRYSYSGDPTIPAFWTERVPFPGTAANPPADRRFHLASGPYTHATNDTLEFTLAIQWSQGSDYLDSVRQLKEDVFRLRIAAPFILNLTEVVETANEPIPPTHSLNLEQFPNPFTNRTTLQYTLDAHAPVRLSVYDLLGREIEVLVDRTEPAGTHTIQFDGSHLPAGIYYARLESANSQLTKKLVLVR
ncbi:MAG: T9SS type A sorting domain-containing protein [Rhodothermaceae bacterium]|nr:T9SS type A sorting domain-containing protein [Rhodothermaceae bacterium]